MKLPISPDLAVVSEGSSPRQRCLCEMAEGKNEISAPTGAAWRCHFRHWLRFMERRLKDAESSHPMVSLGSDYVHRRLSEQQVFQKELERDGAVLVASRKVRRKVAEEGDDDEQAWRSTNDSKSAYLVRRWHDLWLKSLERQCRLESQLHSILGEEGLSSTSREDSDDNEFDRFEPSAKRRRLISTAVDDYDCCDSEEDLDQRGSDRSRRSSSIAEDTIPFAEDEYEPIMDTTTTPFLDDNGNVIDEVAEEEPREIADDRLLIGQRIESVGGDNESGLPHSDGVGFDCDRGSSTPNRGRDEEDQQRRIESPLFSERRRPNVYMDKLTFKRYYKTTTALDTEGGTTTDTDTPRFSARTPPCWTSESGARADSAQSNPPPAVDINDHILDDSLDASKDYKEILRLIDQPHSDDDDMVDSGTIWSPLEPTGRRRSSTRCRTKEDEGIICQSCDASSELSTDEIRETRRYSSSRTLIQGSNDLHLLSSSAVNTSLKRRRKRQSWTKPLPASASENAIMSLSYSSSTTTAANGSSPSTKCSMQLGQGEISWLMTSSMSSSGYGGGGTTANELRSNGGGFGGGGGSSAAHHRKKLRARRMPRSMSDGEHLSFFNRPYRFSAAPSRVDVRSRRDTDETTGCGDGYHPRELETPSAPRATPISDSNDEEDEEEEDENKVYEQIERLDNLIREESEKCIYTLTEGGNDDGAEPTSQHLIVDNEALDDGERTAADGDSTVSGADQSEGVYEWDDYKALHNENGPADQPPLDESNLTTFGDDYRAFLEYMSDSCNSSAPGSARPTARMGEKENLYGALRLPPIGLSHDSDSELDTPQRNQRIVRSQKQLRLTQTAFNKSLQKQHQSALDLYAGLLKNCEQNVNDLEAIRDGVKNRRGGGSGGRGGKSWTKETDDVEALLRSWIDLGRAIRKRVETVLTSASNHQTTTMTMARSINRARRLSEEQEEYLRELLLREMGRLRTSLERIHISQGDYRMTTAISADSGSYGSMEEIDKDLTLLMDLRTKLMAEQQRLDALVRGYKASSQCLSAQYESMGNDVKQLSNDFEHARMSFDTQVRELHRLRQYWKLWRDSEEQCRQLMAEIKSDLEKTSTNHPNSDSASNERFDALQSKIASLEERILRLEILCTKMARPHFGAPFSVNESVSSALRDLTFTVKKESDSLKSMIRDLEPELIGQLTEITSIADGPVELSLESESERSTPATSIKHSSPSVSTSTIVLQILFRYWPVQLCLLIVLLLDVFLFATPACCEHTNRYWWSYGPKTYYSHGPPPT